MEYRNETILQKIKEIHSKKQPILVAIDGRCAAGKTTLAAYLQTSFSCNIIHMDHFFLRPEQRTLIRLQQPGGNVDYERFLEEVLLPLKQKKDFFYRPYDCHQQKLCEKIEILYHSINIIEGSYSCHPMLWDYYDFRIFLTVDPQEQFRRIQKRNGEVSAALFRDKWIPLEEKYFSFYQIQERCDVQYET